MSEEKKKDNILNLDLTETARTKIWVNGDCTKVLELNLTDVGVAVRAKDALGQLDAIQQKINNMVATGVPDDITTEDGEKKLGDVVEIFKELDKQMRELVDFVFDFPVCKICCDGGSMYDPINGQYRYEYIIDKLMVLYDESWKRETKVAQDRMKSHTAKYTKKSTTSRKKR